MVLPSRHTHISFCDELSPAKEECRLHALKLQTLLATGGQRAVDVRRLHVAELKRDPVKSIIYTFDNGTFGVRHAGLVAGSDGQDDDVFVQDMVMFEVVQQGGRRRIDIACQKDRGAGDPQR